MLLGRFKQVIFLAALFTVSPALASAPKVGRAAAAKYFQKGGSDDIKPSRSMASEEGLSSDERFLTFGASYFTSSDSYNWGVGQEENVGKAGLDMSYRLSSSNNLDYALRVAYTEYTPANQRANKLSFLYAASLPDAGSKFPLYFGAAAGPGVFFTQLSGESSVTLDYQLYLGLRLFNVFEKTGFYVEGGLKNHLQLTSDGQLNGTYVSGGAVFTF
jgi:hypothetical protein